MPYDESFYQLYEAYLLEKAVRANHDLMFEHWKRLVRIPLHVIDLGCGIGEYRRYGNSANYMGIDLVNSGQLDNFIEADYTDPANLVADLATLTPEPNAFVSLFSCECCHSAERKYEIYESFFTTFPSIQHGLVSGFFYRSRLDEEVVKEAGGIESFQTVERTPSSQTFSEFRVTIHTPSKMFGQDVIEVWKFFTRRPTVTSAP